MMVTAIRVSISGGNQSASGTKPKAAAISELERARGALRRQEAQGGGDFETETVDAWVDGEFRAVGPDRIFEQHVEELLVPVELQVVGERGPFDVRAGLLVGRERSVRRQRDARVHDARREKAGIVLVEVRS